MAAEKFRRTPGGGSGGGGGAGDGGLLLVAPSTPAAYSLGSKSKSIPNNSSSGANGINASTAFANTPTPPGGLAAITSGKGFLTVPEGVYLVQAWMEHAGLAGGLVQLQLVGVDSDGVDTVSVWSDPIDQAYGQPDLIKSAAGGAWASPGITIRSQLYMRESGLLLVGVTNTGTGTTFEVVEDTNLWVDIVPVMQ